MELSESTQIVYSRIQQLDPVNVAKVIGYLLLHDNIESEMIRLAFGPDNLIISLVNKAKAYIGLSYSSTKQQPTAKSSISPPIHIPPDSNLHVPQFTSFSPRPFSSASNLSYWNPQMTHDHHHQMSRSFDNDQHSFFDYDDDHIESSYTVNGLGGGIAGTNRRSPPESPVKICHYFSKGFCKNGSSCKFFHGHGHTKSSPKSNEMTSEDHVFPPSCSLQKLEMELTGLLKSRRGFPISIASLPMMYYEKYGKTLQAEGYLTESQRHGKAGYSLTKLLARLKNSIRLIDRCNLPHGQHSVILAEDVPRFVEYGNERDSGAIVVGSRQIYLTFPAESTFSEEDVCNYFNNFGFVEDVRIPCQPKRMFGFVTFVYVETVKQILAKGNPHFVCGARVLVKPYREKSRPVDHKYNEKFNNPMYYVQQFKDDEECNFHHLPTIYGDSRVLQKQLEEQNEKALRFEKRQLTGFQLAPKASFRHMPYFGYSTDDLEVSEEPEETEDDLARRFSYLLDVANSEDNGRQGSTDYNDLRSYEGFNLPENPFSFPIGNNGVPVLI